MKDEFARAIYTLEFASAKLSRRQYYLPSWSLTLGPGGSSSIPLLTLAYAYYNWVMCEVEPWLSMYIIAYFEKRNMAYEKHIWIYMMDAIK